MSQNGAVFQWDQRKLRAAQLVAANEKTNAEIARACRIAARTLDRWKAEPEFAAKVREFVRGIRDAILQEGIADKQQRLLALQDEFNRIEQVLAERAKDPLVQEVPGGQTGMIVPEPMLVKVYRGDDAESDGDGTAEGEELTIIPKTSRLVHKFTADLALMKERRDTLKQAAIELGEWEEKVEHSGEMLVRQYVGISPEDV